MIRETYPSDPVPADPAPLDHLALCGRGDAPALVLKHAVLSYDALNSRIALLSGWLARQLAQHGDEAAGARVASWCAKSEIACLLPLAAARAGMVHVPINPVLKRAQAVHILRDSGAAMLIGGKARLASLEEGDVAQSCILHDETAVMEQALALGDALPPSQADPESLAAILYTSGSTGNPKGVMLSHANLWLGAVSVAHYLGLASDDRVLAVLPFAFDYGQNQLLSSWRAGACAVPLDYLLPRDVMRAVESHAITTLAAVPPLWVQLTELEWTAAAASSLRRLTNSGGALTPDLITALRNMAPQAQIFAMYGLTEAFRSSFLDPALLADHPRSIGKAIPFAELMLVNDAGADAAAGEEGELVHAGPLVAQGYWRDAMIKTSGNRVSPQEVEDAAVATGLVAEAVALGIADERLGHAIHLVCRAAPGVDATRLAGLETALARSLPNFMVPKVIHWRDAMPTGATGKLDRVGLAKEIAELP